MLNCKNRPPLSTWYVGKKNGLITSGDKQRKTNKATTNRNGFHLSPLNRKHAIKDRSSSESSSRFEDSYSDSAYSQSSDASFGSDVRSLNTISTDSENNRLYDQRIATKLNGFNHQRDSDAMDVDEGFLKRVLMLMKVVLYLRHNFPVGLKWKRKVFPDISIGKTKLYEQSSSSSSSSDATGDSLSGRSPRTEKRISFSPTTLLFSAITEKAFSEAQAILEEDDVDVNAQTPSGQSLLHIAAANADLKCVRLLLQHGAKVNVEDGNGWSPLHAAVRRGNWKCAILLIEAGADFADYAQKRIKEYNQVLQMSRSCFRSVEIFV